MNHIIPQYSSKFSILALLAVLLLSGCRDHHFDDLEVVDDSTTILVDIPMLQAPSLTRAGMTAPQESRLKNLFVAVFSEDGTQRVYSHFYDESDLEAARKEDTSEFKIQLTGETFGGGKYKAFAVANVRTGGTDEFKQRVILTKSELEAMQNITDYTSKKVKLDQAKYSAADERKEVLLFSSKVCDLKIGGNGEQPTLQRIPLERIMSKVTILFSTESKGFAPKYISVFNLPVNSQLASEVATSTDAYGNDNDYFEVEEQRIEGTGNGTRYTFYMLESMLTPRTHLDPNDPQAYRNRAKRRKETDSNPEHHGAVINREFVNAPVHAPYVFIKGYYDLEVKEKSKTKAMVADVEYTIPLGYTNPADRNNDYNIERNTTYNYTIKVKGINDIVIEATRDTTDPNPDQERHPGTEGTALISEIHWELDSHFEQRLLPISKKQLVNEIDFATMRFTVTTPYGHETFSYADLKDNGPKGERCRQLTQWIQFRQNYMTDVGGYRFGYDDTSANNPSRYPQKKYATGKGTWLQHNHKLLSLREFIELLEAQKAKANSVSDEDFGKNSTAVFGYYQVVGQAKHPDMAYFTVFFDENYYEENPLQPGVKAHWRDFVNGAPRKFVMTLSASISRDRKSIYYGKPFISVSQRPIYVPYSTLNAEVTDNEPIYGFETINETGLVDLPAEINSFGDNIHGAKNSYIYLMDRGWKTKHHWSDYLEYGDNYSMYIIKDGITEDAFDACMLRNRDIDQNGRIDPYEMLWYVPGIAQLLNFQLGALGVPEDARLYRESDTDPDPDHRGLQNHWIVSSSKGNNGSAYPYFLWSDQGMSIGAVVDQATAVNGNYGNKRKYFQLRCARTLQARPKGVAFDDLNYHEKLREAKFYRLANKSDNEQGKPRYVAVNFLNDRAIRLPYQFIEKGEQKLHSFRDDYVDKPPFNVLGKFKVLQPISERSLPYREFYVAKKAVQSSVFKCRDANLASTPEEMKAHPSPCADYSETYGSKELKGWRMPTILEMQAMSESGITNEWQKDVDYFTVTMANGVTGSSVMLARPQTSGIVPLHIFYANTDLHVFVRCVKDKED